MRLRARAQGKFTDGKGRGEVNRVYVAKRAYVAKKFQGRR